MKVTVKQKIQKVELWLDQIREEENIEGSDKDNLTIAVGKSKVFLDKNNKKNDKILIDYIVIIRSELSMLDGRMLETIYKLALNDHREGKK